MVVFIGEIAKTEGYEWFRNEIASKLNLDSELGNPTAIEEIYEYCIRLIIKEQAEKFYEDFKLIDIKEDLLEDFVRMEKFRREDNFEDFCLALFQQIEGIVNELITEDLQNYIIEHKDDVTHKTKDKTRNELKPQKMWQLFFYPLLETDELNKKLNKSIKEWDFSERYKVVLYFFYFTPRSFNYLNFNTMFFLGNELYQSRNLSHRGGSVSNKQRDIQHKVKTNSYKYYFKFLGFLEDFTSKVNLNI